MIELTEGFNSKITGSTIAYSIEAKGAFFMGKFIVLTGLDGSGTSSIAEKLLEKDTGALFYKSLPKLYSEKREEIDIATKYDSPTAHLHYYLSANCYLSDLIKKDILKYPQSNIYCVRYFIDTVVSQRASGIDIEYEYQQGFLDLIKPDFIFYLDVDESERQRRLDNRGKGFLDLTLDKDDFRNRFLDEFKNLENEYIRINTTNRSIDDIAQEILDFVNMVEVLSK